MPITAVEDGTGLTTADAYCDEDFVTDYHEARGGADHAAWQAASSATRENAIVRACTYIDQRFGARFVGTRTSAEQGLEWPRDDAVDRDGFEHADSVPLMLKRAVAEYAVRALDNRLMPDPDPPIVQAETNGAAKTTNTTGAVAERSVKVGPIEETTRYSTTRLPSGNEHGIAPAWALPAYPAADLWLSRLLRPTGRVTR